MIKLVYSVSTTKLWGFPANQNVNVGSWELVEGYWLALEVFGDFHSIFYLLFLSGGCNSCIEQTPYPQDWVLIGFFRQLVYVAFQLAQALTAPCMTKVVDFRVSRQSLLHDPPMHFPLGSTRPFSLLLGGSIVHLWLMGIVRLFGSFVFLLFSLSCPFYWVVCHLILPLVGCFLFFGNVLHMLSTM